MSKKLDISQISNELKGRSLHFSRPILSPTPLTPEPVPTPPVESLPISLPVPPPTLTEPPINVSKETKKQISEETSFQVDKETEKQVSKETKKQRNKKLKRYATYLSEDSILAMQKIAFETRRRDYEVFQEAVEKYIKRNTD